MSLNLPYTYPTVDLPYTYPILGRQTRTAPMSPTYPILRLAQTVRPPALSAAKSRGLPYKAQPQAKAETAPPRPSPARAPGAYPTKPARQSVRDALPQHSLSFLPLHPPAGAGVSSRNLGEEGLTLSRS